MYKYLIFMRIFLIYRNIVFRTLIFKRSGFLVSLFHTTVDKSFNPRKV